MQTQAASCLLASLSLRAAAGESRDLAQGSKHSLAGLGKSRWADTLLVCVSAAEVGRDHSPYSGRRRWLPQARALISLLSIERTLCKRVK